MMFCQDLTANLTSSGRDCVLENWEGEARCLHLQWCGGRHRELQRQHTQLHPIPYKSSLVSVMQGQP